MIHVHIVCHAIRMAQVFSTTLAMLFHFSFAGGFKEPEMVEAVTQKVENFSFSFEEG